MRHIDDEYTIQHILNRIVSLNETMAEYNNRINKLEDRVKLLSDTIKKNEKILENEMIKRVCTEDLTVPMMSPLDKMKGMQYNSPSARRDTEKGKLRNR